jgi:hypothetical protein
MVACAGDRTEYMFMSVLDRRGRPEKHRQIPDSARTAMHGGKWGIAVPLAEGVRSVFRTERLDVE